MHAGGKRQSTGFFCAIERASVGRDVVLDALRRAGSDVFNCLERGAWRFVSGVSGKVPAEFFCD